MIIRQMTIHDVPALTKLSEYFWFESAVCECFGNNYPKEIVHRKLFNGIASGEFISWGCEDDGKIVSMIVLIKTKNLWTDENQLAEILWYSCSDRRLGFSNIKLLMQVENWAKQNNIDILIMGRIKGVPSYEKLPKFYKSLGYNQMEETFIKKL